MILIIDGYNLIFKVFSRKKENKGPKDLVELVEKYIDQKKDIAAYIIFDGCNEESTEKKMNERLTVIYTKQRTDADTAILRMLNNDIKDPVVVSSDSKIFSKATNKGAVCIFSQEFAGILRSVIDGTEFRYCFRDKKNESKRKGIINTLCKIS